MAFDWAGVIDHSKRNARSNVLLLESTYGDRLHEVDGTRVQFADAIRRIAHRGGSVLIPAFSVDRTEVILTELAQLRNTGETPDLPIVLDSPMALACLRVHRGPLADGWPEERTEPILDEALDPDRLIEVTDDAAGSGPADRGHRRYQSARWNDPRMPVIIISASGRAAGGRVLYHLGGCSRTTGTPSLSSDSPAEGTRPVSSSTARGS